MTRLALWMLALAASLAPSLTLAAPPPSAPFNLENLRYPDLNGQPRQLAQWRGKVVVLNFWATWCNPCREEMPMLNRYADRYGGAVAVVGVALDNPVAVRNFVREFGIRYPILLGDAETSQWMRAAGNTQGGLPFTVVLDPAGQPVARAAGAAHRGAARCGGAGTAAATVIPSRPAHRPARQRFSSSALLTTDTELAAIAAPAITGFSQPNAASGMPNTL